MKNIVIIEDNFDHFRIISRLIAQSNIDVFPKQITSNRTLQKFLSPIRSMIIDSNSARRKKFQADFLGSDGLKRNGVLVPISLFIVDYELFKENRSITGIEFCKNIDDIIEGKIPVILLTILPGGKIDSEKENFIIDNPKTRGKIFKLRKLQDSNNEYDVTWDDGNETIVDNDKKIEKVINNSNTIKRDLIKTIEALCNLTSKETIEELCCKIIQKHINLEDDFTTTIESLKNNYTLYKPELIEILREILEKNNLSKLIQSQFIKQINNGKL
jgi:hypothetical protein